MSSSCNTCGHGDVQPGHACPACGAWSAAELAGAVWEGISSSVQIGVRRRKIRASTAAALLAGFFAAGAVIGWAARPDAGGGGNPVQENGSTPLVPPFTRGDEGGSGDDAPVAHPSEKPTYRRKEMSDDDLRFAAKFDVRIDRILVEGRIGGNARTYEVGDGKCYVYRTTVRAKNRNFVSLSTGISHALAAFGPYFVVIDHEESGDLFVVPGKILSPEVIEGLPKGSGTGSTRAAAFRPDGTRVFLRTSDWSLDITPYKNAFHLLQ
ncbi:MAG: hypothetical protein A3G34_04455 [Candidatus Lindowbacteria bacterium RIFCSPLOWO2_12_FULL_62_27]|nr:MAG: hypothetical protein A3I06_04220 [Candidatus Lindowbacteria bacterium RIFCSPLOWO2_02_FULL_62_12]OGH57414.1 MAG: hypothetical protein A3G34_04455 [Candidatus Lindowbacteria bacterium RIFCSPLOWO2_12_FULL_62_27]